MHFKFISAATLFLAMTGSAVGKKHSQVFLIRHGEKPPTGDGLSAQGESRAACLPNVCLSGIQAPNFVMLTLANRYSLRRHILISVISWHKHQRQTVDELGPC